MSGYEPRPEQQEQELVSGSVGERQDLLVTALLDRPA
jgi:hypothetical protein